LGGLGHEVVLIPPQYIKPYVKRGKNDKIDAEAICEAMSRPSMRFVPVKTTAQQAALAMLGVRDLLVKQRTMLINAIRGHAAEFGAVAAKGPKQISGRTGRPARRAGDQIEGNREPVDGLAPAGSDQPMPGDDPRDRADRRRQLCSQGGGSEGLSLEPALCLLGGHHAARRLDRRAAEARQNQPRRR
jgi:transposase